ncbi:tail fiber domain-containing protein [Providencia hangzhouensis]|uniref:tail fiber/spike domain-containing protein n=1 Tax=Providencia hangzhouensis TaxID=3031799 RepID=UPI0034DD16D6
MRQNVKPTQEPVPSSDIKNLFFNSGLLDIWATSLEHKYIDRFGNCHLTAAGMEWLFKELVEKFKIDMNTAIVAAGYITIDSFQQGADLPNNELTQRNHILRDETTGEYYRWDGDLPKQAPAGSTPQSTGGIGKGAWVSVGDASLRSDLRSSEGAKHISNEQGTSLQHEIDYLYEIKNTVNLITSDESVPTYELKNNDRYLGVNGNATEVKAPAGKAAFHAIGMEDALLDGLKISGDGKAGTGGTGGIYIEGTQSSKQPLRNEFKNLRIQDLRDFGLRLSAGWGNIVRLSRFTNIGKSGIAIEPSPILSGWGGSGHVFEAVYAANCGEYGISNYTGWCNTFINPVLEYNGAAFRERGNNSVWINPWLEGNENPPLVERGVVILGGRGISFRNSLRRDLTEFEPEETVTHIQNKGISIFRNQELKVLNVNGTGFKEARSTSGMEIAGARASTSETRIPLIRLTGYSTPTSAGAASFDKLVSEIQLNASGSEAQNGSNYGRIVFKTGVNVSVGDSPYPISNRWEVRYDGVFHPSEDNKYSIGRPGLRVSEIYSAVGNINTSDERYKIPIDVSDDTKEREKKAALEIKSSIYRFQFKDAIDVKGNHARTHFGVGAQTVMSIMEKHGLDARGYGFFCHDQWDDIYDSWEDEFKEELTDDVDEKGEQVINKILVKKAGSKLIKPAGEIYGIRYDELCMFILAAL